MWRRKNLIQEILLQELQSLNLTHSTQLKLIEIERDFLLRTNNYVYIFDFLYFFAF